MLGKTAPYHVRILTLTSTETGAVTVTLNPYRAGSGAVILYCAEDRPADIARLAACGLPMTLAELALFFLGLAELCSFARPPVHAAADRANMTAATMQARSRLMPPR